MKLLSKWLSVFLDKGHRANNLTQVAVPEKCVKSSQQTSRLQLLYYGVFERRFKFVETLTQDPLYTNNDPRTNNGSMCNIGNSDKIHNYHVLMPPPLNVFVR